MLKGFISFFFSGFPKVFIQSAYRKLVFLGLRLSWPSQIKAISVANQRFQINDKLGFFWQYYEIYYKQFYRFNTASSSPVIIDCGANIGLSASWFLQNYPQATLICFEPDPIVFGKLSKNLSQQRSAKLVLRNEAVFTKEATMLFKSDGKDGGMLSNEASADVIEVKAIDFNSFLKGFEKIDMLKIDIEGAEKELVPHIASQLHKVENMFIEYHHHPIQTPFLADILKHLEQANFVYRIESVVKMQNPISNSRLINGYFMQANIFATKRR